MDPLEFQNRTNVSRETLDRLGRYVELLLSWQRAVNLVGPGTLNDVWSAHILDCAQLLPHLPPAARSLIDIGSGAGLPGLVLAIMGHPGVHLVEKDGRKCEFLREAARITRTQVQIHNVRIEDMKPFPVDVVTARACAPLDKLLRYSAPFLGKSGVCVYLKGSRWESELTQAKKSWNIVCAAFRSTSSRHGSILRIRQEENGLG